MITYVGSNDEHWIARHDARTGHWVRADSAGVKIYDDYTLTNGYIQSGVWITTTRARALELFPAIAEHIPDDPSTYEQYLELRHELGYPEENAMVEAVWNGCEPDAQENMLQQFHTALRNRVADPDLPRTAVDAW